MRFGGKRISILAESVELCLRLGRYVSLPIVPIVVSVVAILFILSKFVTAPQWSRDAIPRREVQGCDATHPERARLQVSWAEDSYARAESFPWKAFSINR
jgi:hypothetical protein